MWKNCKGFSLVETLVAFTIILTTVTIFTSLFTQVIHERRDLEKKRIAINLLHDQMQRYLYDSRVNPPDEVFSEAGTTFTINWETVQTNMKRGCIHWEGEARNQALQLCLYGKRM